MASAVDLDASPDQHRGRHAWWGRRLATVGLEGMPHVVPVAFRYNPFKRRGPWLQPLHLVVAFREASAQAVGGGNPA